LEREQKREKKVGEGLTVEERFLKVASWRNAVRVQRRKNLGNSCGEGGRGREREREGEGERGEEPRRSG
jgi:hypothetical protein